MFEQEGVLRTWACEQLPTANNESVAAEQLEDHRLAYLDYEGPVSGNRGNVMRIDAGEYEVLSVSLEEFRVRIAGRHFYGIVTISRESGGALLGKPAVAPEGGSALGRRLDLGMTIRRLFWRGLLGG